MSWSSLAPAALDPLQATITSNLETGSRQKPTPTLPATIAPRICYICRRIHRTFEHCRPLDEIFSPPAKSQAQTTIQTDDRIVLPALQDTSASAVMSKYGTATGKSTTSYRASRGSRRSQKREKWASIKDAFHQLYVVEGKTLEYTMAEFERKYSFRASERKWKMQIKEWNFEKNINQKDMAILVAKEEKRARDEEKETSFYWRGKQIRPEKLANFKKRRIVEEIVPASPSAETPMDITYGTPRNHDILDDIEEVNEMFGSHECDDDRYTSSIRLPERALNDFKVFIETPGMDKLVDWYLYDLDDVKATPVKTTSIHWAGKAIDTSFQRDLSILKRGSLVLPGSKFTASCLEILDRARSDTRKKTGEHVNGMIRYLGGITYGLKHWNGNPDIFLPHIANFLDVRRTLNFHLWIATYMRQNPFQELLKLIKSSFGPTATVTLDLSARLENSESILDMGWARKMHILMREVEENRNGYGRSKQRLYWQLTLAETALIKKPLDKAQTILSTALLEYVSNDMTFSLKEELSFDFIIREHGLQGMHSWIPHIWAMEPDWHGILKNLLNSVIDEIRGHMIRQPASVVEDVFDVTASLAIATAATLCGDTCVSKVYPIFTELLMKIDSSSGSNRERLKACVLLHRCVYHATVGDGEGFEEDSREARLLIGAMADKVETAGWYLAMEGLWRLVQRNVNRYLAGKSNKGA